MPRAIRIHLDENCSQAIAEGLRRRGIDVTTTPEVGLLGAIDVDQLAYCLAEGRIIFSYDDDLLRLAASGVEHAGIVYCQQRKRSIGDIVRGLVLIWERLDHVDMAGQVEPLALLRASFFGWNHFNFGQAFRRCPSNPQVSMSVTQPATNMPTARRKGQFVRLGTSARPVH